MFTQRLGPPRGDPAWPKVLFRTLIMLGLGVLSPHPNSLGMEFLPEMGHIWPGVRAGHCSHR